MFDMNASPKKMVTYHKNEGVEEVNEDYQQLQQMLDVADRLE